MTTPRQVPVFCSYEEIELRYGKKIADAVRDIDKQVFRFLESHPPEDGEKK